nr:MAG TPA: hypothetical protein [Caudoviricetes sp.]
MIHTQTTENQINVLLQASCASLHRLIKLLNQLVNPLLI